MKKLGLIGYPLGHSFSKSYYLNKFENENIIDIDYDLYPIEHISSFEELYLSDPNYVGFNITIPHKQNIMPYLTELSTEAKEIQAVNCITIKRSGEKVILKGYNTDAYGFQKSLQPLLQSHHTHALILGNGGAAKAVCYALRQLGIEYKLISRTKAKDQLTYQDLDKEIMASHKLIINCTPLGTYPNVSDFPDIPYEFITSDHLLYDLIYNPEETTFLSKGKANGATIKNGYEMLVLQAGQNWKIWNHED